MKIAGKKLSGISALHYGKLAVRSVLFLSVLAAYLLDRAGDLARSFPLLLTVWVFYVVEMILRFFPSRLESMGCQKQFARNYRPTGTPLPRIRTGRPTAAVAAAWLLLNGAIGGLYFAGILDVGILILISLAYSVCDIVCILFFCPFQTWFMKNRCCTTCRIYNWDFAMMFTPLVFIPRPYTYSLLGLSLLLLLRWEITWRRHPERFLPETNACLACKNCDEKLCSHKTQLQSFLKKHRDRLFS